MRCRFQAMLMTPFRSGPAPPSSFARTSRFHGSKRRMLCWREFPGEVESPGTGKDAT